MPATKTKESNATAKVEFHTKFPNLVVFIRSPQQERRPDGRIKYVGDLKAKFHQCRFSTDDPEMIEGLRTAKGFGKLFHELDSAEIDKLN